MESHGKSWKVIEDYGRLWNLVETSGIPWKVMEGHGRLWNIMEDSKNLPEGSMDTALVMDMHSISHGHSIISSPVGYIRTCS